MPAGFRRCSSTSTGIHHARLGGRWRSSRTGQLKSARIHGADAETLLTWGEQVLTASRVEAIFGEPGGHLEGAN
ncbi:hypothetical protein CCP4SC76_7520003 [Gammaproteobacteria bacterium]